MTEAPEGGLLAAADMPMDPDDIQTQTSFGPMITIDDGTPEQDFGPELTAEQEAEHQAQEDLDPEARQDFIGLMRLGYLEETCTIAGHRFLIRTPTHDARIERGNLHREYLNSMNTEPVWRLITVALYLVEIDGVPAPEPLNTRTYGVTDRLRWVKETIFSSYMIEKLYMETLRLDSRERNVVEYLDGQVKD